MVPTLDDVCAIEDTSFILMRQENKAKRRKTRTFNRAYKGSDVRASSNEVRERKYGVKGEKVIQNADSDAKAQYDIDDIFFSVKPTVTSTNMTQEEAEIKRISEEYGIAPEESANIYNLSAQFEKPYNEVIKIYFSNKADIKSVKQVLYFEQKELGRISKQYRLQGYQAKTAVLLHNIFDMPVDDIAEMYSGLGYERMISILEDDELHQKRTESLTPRIEREMEELSDFLPEESDHNAEHIISRI